MPSILIQRRTAWIGLGLCAAVFDNPFDAFASLSGPPQSFVKTCADGRHFLVMQSHVKLPDDDGRFAVLPDGQYADLRLEFPASGLYAIGSRTPVWAVDWYGEEGWLVLSRDGRHCVRLNRFGGGGYGQGVSPTWAMRFYECGRETKCYETVELVDYPNLMDFTSADWHHVWWKDIDQILVNGQMILAVQTSTHEEYQFDIVTGAMIYEWRMWRRLALIARIGIPLLLVMCAVAGVWMKKRSRMGKLLVGMEGTSDATPAIVTPPRQLQFSLKSLFVATAVIAALLAISDRYSEASFWAACILFLFAPAMYWTYATSKRRTVLRGSVFQRRARGVAWYAAGFLFWTGAYVLSYFPTQWSMREARVDWDVRVVVMQSIYRPVFWLCDETPAGEVVRAIERCLRI
jgi:hypothetical protein